MKVYIQTDVEGVAGVVDFDFQTHSNSPGFAQASRLLTAEVNAAVEGALAGGATEIVVDDGHSHPITLDIERLHPKAQVILGTQRPHWLAGLDGTFDGLMMIGQHPKAATPAGNLSHSFARDVITEVTLNGQSVGEFGVAAAIAGSFDAATILVSGDEAVCKEAQDLVPGICTAAVKKGLSRLSALNLSPTAAGNLIRDKAKAAMEQAKTIGPYRPKPLAQSPYYRLRIVFSFPIGEQTIRHKAPNINVIDTYTLEYVGDDLFETLDSYHAWG